MRSELKKEKTRQNRIYVHASSPQKRGSDELDDAKIDVLYRAIMQQVDAAERTTAKAKSRKNKR
jgi:hypothetical protein